MTLASAILMVMLATTAGPPRLVTPLSPPEIEATPRIIDVIRLSPATGLGLVAGSVVVGGGMLALAFLAWHVRTEPPERRAFRSMARRMGLDAAERRALLDAARARRVGPVGLLVSTEALRRVLREQGAGPGAGPSAGSALSRLARRCGAGTDAARDHGPRPAH